MSRLRWLVLLVLLASGCGGAKHHASGSVIASAEPTIAPSATGAPSATPAGGAPSSTVKPGTAPGPPAAPAASAAPAPAPTVKGPVNKPGSGPTPAASGTYRYHQTGSATVGSTTKPIPPDGTLRIDPAGSDGNQVWHRYIDPSGPPSDIVFAFRNGGIFIVQTVQRTNAGGQQSSFTCTFSPPMAAPPWPPTAGSTFQGHGDCGQFTVDVAGQVSVGRDVVLDGATHHTFQLSSNLTFHGQLEGSGRQVDLLDPATSLTLHEETAESGKYGGVVTFAAQSKSDLVSTKPQ